MRATAAYPKEFAALVVEKWLSSQAWLGWVLQMSWLFARVLVDWRCYICAAVNLSGLQGIYRSESSLQLYSGA